MHENLLKWMDFNRFVWLVDMIMSSILGLYLGVRTCEHFHCVAPFFLGSILLTSLFYVTREFYRFLHQGWTNFSFLEMRYMEGFLIGLIYDVSLWSRLIDDHDIHHWLLTPVLSACMRHNVAFTMWGTNHKQLLDEVFVISRIIKVEVSIIARLKGILCNLWTPWLSIVWHHRLLCQVSVDSRSPYWSTVGQHVNRYIGLHLTDMAVSVSVDMSTLSADLSVNMSAFSRSTIAQHISQHVDWESGDGFQRRDEPGVSQYVYRYGNRELADISTDMSIEYQPIVSTDTQARNAQITQDLLKAEADNTYRDLDYFGYHKNQIQGCALRKIEGSPVL